MKRVYTDYRVLGFFDVDDDCTDEEIEQLIEEEYHNRVFLCQILMRENMK